MQADLATTLEGRCIVTTRQRRATPHDVDEASPNLRPCHDLRKGAHVVPEKGRQNSPVRQRRPEDGTKPARPVNPSSLPSHPAHRVRPQQQKPSLQLPDASLILDRSRQGLGPPGSSPSLARLDTTTTPTLHPEPRAAVRLNITVGSGSLAERGKRREL